MDEALIGFEVVSDTPDAQEAQVSFEVIELGGGGGPPGPSGGRRRPVIVAAGD